MRISRIFTDQPLSPGTRVRLEEKAGHYLSRVLKLRVGDPLVLFNGDGSDYAGEIESMARTGPVVAVSTRLPAAAESPLAVTLVQAISRGERMDQTLQKSTELGVAAVRPVFTTRVEVRLKGDRLEKRMAHWRGVLSAACEQSGRATVPRLFSPLELTEWCAQPERCPRLVLEPGADRELTSLVVKESRVELLVGPEGGLTEQESEQLENARIMAVRLGPRTLRTETAGPAAVAVLQAMAGDF